MKPSPLTYAVICISILTDRTRQRHSISRRIQWTVRWLFIHAGLVILSGCVSYQQTRQLMQAPPDLPPRVILEDVPFFPQEAFQCGPAALAMVLNYSAHETLAARPETGTASPTLMTHPDQLTPYVYIPGKQGSLQTELVSTTRSFGRVPYIISPNLSTLLTEISAGHPVLVLQNLGISMLPRWHYAVVIGYDLEQGEILLRSGTDALKSYRFATFERSWQDGDYWGLIVTRPDRLPATVEAVRWIQHLEDLRTTGHLEAASEGYQQALTTWPDHPLVLTGWGNLAYQLEDFAQAESAFRQIIQRDPHQAAAWNNLAYSLAEQGCGNAGNALSCAIKLQPNRSEFESSRTDIDRLLEANPSFICAPLPTCPAPRGSTVL